MASVLVVDDDKIVLELASEVLSMNGFDCVTTAASGSQALALIEDRDSTFDAILLDIQMPVMDGIETCRRMRELAEYRSQPIIMLTAMQDKSYVNAAFESGATDYITKPFDPFDLAMRLARNLEQTHGRPCDASYFRPETLCQDADCLVTFDSLKNFLRQMKRCAVENAVVAVRIENIDELMSDLDSEEFSCHLHHVARVLSNHLREEFSLATLLDRGTFVVVSEGPVSRFDGLFRADLESSVNLHMERKTSIAIGDAVRCRKFREVNEVEVIEQAMQSLETSHPRRPSLSHFGLQTSRVVQ